MEVLISLRIVISQARLWDRRGDWFFVWGFYGFGAFLKSTLIFLFEVLSL